MTTSSISTSLKQPLVFFFFSLLIKTSLSSSPPLSPLHSLTTNPNSSSPTAADRLIPSSTTIEYRQMEANATKALSGQSASYHTCRQCKCCEIDDPKHCYILQCCYEVACNSPNDPPDMCSVKPISCNCNSCH
ncbi:uncharacterized protein LOC110027286 [Phalaenopsis equestris]|uniref:uncharacterized protein LOC110027286 n=1 Tax=Phalaenopsis equestris TaxID=78828 RepID=UPI0009E56F23|nr:uncharacterized protein LOC110027286 [Phalaenopsis equestris]